MKGLDYLKVFKSKNTVKVYRAALKSFMSSVYGVKFDGSNGDLEKYADRYLKEKRDYKSDLQNFLASIGDRPPMTVRTFVTGVKMFLQENEIELNQQFWRGLSRRIKGSRPLTLDRIPSNAELKKIILQMQGHGKALFLLLSSSGMRIGEALKIQGDDIELDKDSPRIKIRGEYTKTGNSRITYMSSEAKEAIQDWLKQRESYLKTAAAKSMHNKPLEDSRLFPFNENTAYLMWTNALRKLGLLERDKSTERATMHPHVLRKFFRTRLGGVIPVDVVEALMGHEGYLTEVYRRYSEEDLAAFYKRGEHALAVFSNGADMSKVKAELEDSKKVLNEGMATLALKNAELENRLAALIASNQAWDLKLKEIEKNQEHMGELIEKALELETKRRNA